MPAVDPRIAIRIADEADIDVLARLRRTWSEENAGQSIDDSDFDVSFRAWCKQEQHTRTFFLVEVDARPVGMANVKRYDRMPVAGRPTGGWWGYVGNVFVLQDYRNMGVGRVLMDGLIRWSFDAGAEHLRLAPSPRSKSFYERLGFEPGAVVQRDP
ncbi:MAG TPA: GNAT family N-acetyltransferase [Acidimicrobiales bacterium]|jgi:GNAT superfamily N-acetyltransferase|nr:GNAT family N-acetyltransferase [Acidimicrobiales bacterium]